MDIYEEANQIHAKLKGKISVSSKMPLRNKHDLSLAYTPGVAQPCREIAKNPKTVYDYTMKSNSLAVVSDGSAVLGLGNIGAEASLPVMEGKALLFKELAGIDAWPICLKTQDTDEIVSIVKNIAPGFGGINLEDISAPRCFDVYEQLMDIGIPVWHDDQDGTATVTLAALINACKLTGKEFSGLRIAINGAGSAGIAIARILLKTIKPADTILCDSQGAIYKGRENLNRHKEKFAELTNKEKLQGSIHDAVKDADVFIGVSVANTLSKADIKSMAPDPIVFAMANPEPEIYPQDAIDAGASIVGTGRSDFPNQINNVLEFPGIFRGAFDANAYKINEEMILAGAYALAGAVKNPSKEMVLPSPLDRSVVPILAEAVKEAAIKTKVVRK